MLVAYFDESASQNPRDVFVVGACVSTARRWRRFVTYWCRTLEQAGLPPVFHATDFESWPRRPPYNRLKEEQRLPLQKKLLKLIKQHTIVAVSEALPLTEYEAMFGRHLHPDARDYNDPYLFCFAACLVGIAESYRDGTLPRDEKIKCIVEQTDSRGGIDRAFVRLKASDALVGVFSGIEFGTKQDDVPLQAADVLAYETMKHAKNTILGPTFRDTRKSLLNLTTTVAGFNIKGGYYHPNKLRELVYRTLQDQERRERQERA